LIENLQQPFEVQAISPSRLIQEQY